MSDAPNNENHKALNYIRACVVLLGLNAFLLGVIIQKLSVLVYNLVMMRGSAI